MTSRPRTESVSVFLTRTKVCARYGVCQMTLWRWEQKAELKFPPSVRINGRAYFKLADIEAWEQSRRQVA